MPTPEKPKLDPKWTEEQTKIYMKTHENAYLNQMKGERKLFIQALEAEMKVDEEQTNYALRTFYKNWMKQGDGVMGDVDHEM